MTPAIHRERPCRDTQLGTAATSRRPRRVAMRLVLGAALAVGVAGCDDNGNAALDAQAKATGTLAAGGVPDSKVVGELASAAKEDRATPVNVQARQAYAQAKLAVANAKAVEAGTAEAQAVRETAAIESRARQAQQAKQLADTYGKLGPAKAIQTIQSYGTELKGGASAATFGVGQATMPTLAATQKEHDRLDGEVKKLESQIADLTQQRDAKLATAGERSSQADREKGEARLEQVKQAAAARQEAAETSRQIAAAQSQLALAQADLAVQQGLLEQWKSAVASFDAQNKALTTGGDQLAASSKSLRDLAVSQLTGENGEIPSVKTRSAALADSLKKAADARQAAQQAYGEAIKAFEDARKLGAALTQELAAGRGGGGEPFEAGAWNALTQLFNADPVNLDKAGAQLALGDLRAGEARLLTRQLGAARLVESLSKDLQQPVPEPLDPAAVQKSLEDALKAADGAYADALTTLEGVTLSAANLAALRPAKETYRALALHNRAALAGIAETSNVSRELAGNTKFEADAVAAVKQARTDNVYLPPLPGALAAPPTTAPSAPPAEAGNAASPAAPATPAGDAGMAPASPEPAAPAAPASAMPAPAATPAPAPAATPAPAAAPAPAATPAPADPNVPPSIPPGAPPPQPIPADMTNP